MSNRNFYRFLLLWGGELLSGVGSGLTSFGLSIYVLHATGRAASMGLVSLAAFLPVLLLSVPAGVLADRYDRRLLMMAGDSLSALGILYISLCMHGGGAALWQICLGVAVSAVFSALLEPAFRATVTDLLTEKEFSRASGLLSLAGSARYLISPVLAGILLAVSDIQVLLLLDILTFFPTVLAAAIVRKDLSSKKAETENISFGQSMKGGWHVIAGSRGLLVLVGVSSLITCFMGCLQILAQPVILGFASSATLGMAETVCACGMLVSGLFLGARGLKGNYVGILSGSLAAAGISMVLFGLWENIGLVCVFGFLFFAMLPFANNCLDFLVRTNIPDRLQGRVWGVIGFLSQMGYVVAYGLAGVAADGLSDLLGTNLGRGSAWVVVIAGVLLSVTALCVYPMKSVRSLEGEHGLEAGLE